MGRELVRLWLVWVVLAAAGNVQAGSLESRAPVAVLPFANVNRAADLNWMSTGIAETLISDIRQRSGLSVVEREQLDRALNELAFQSSVATDASTAARVGRIVGARTVVLGGFQRAGSALRITARFVEVETGLVLDAAKATGPVERIFDLQDQIVRRLLGQPAEIGSGQPSVGSAHQRRRPRGKKAVAAYRVYAESLASPTETKRAVLLKKALALDPDFIYARQDLDALERRLAQYELEIDRALDQRGKQLRRAIRDPQTAPAERGRLVHELFGILAANRRYRAVEQFAEEVYGMSWPTESTVATAAVPEIAFYWLVTAKITLKQRHQALQLGEQFLQTYPASIYAAAVSTNLQQLLAEQRRALAAAEKVGAALVDNDRELASLDFGRCEALFDHFAFSAALQSCGEFVEANQHTEDERLRSRVGRARYFRILAAEKMGDFGQARVLAKRFIQEEPQLARKRRVDLMIRDWPLE